MKRTEPSKMKGEFPLVTLSRLMVLRIISFPRTSLNLNIPKAAIFLWLLCLSILPAYSQKDNVYFEQITVERGLSQSSVLSIAQDSVGFMWFGTKDGLSKYDGRQFEVYKHHPLDKSSISSSLNVNALLTDSKGNLWIGTQNGLNKYLPKSNTFLRFQHHPKRKNTISHNAIRCIYEDKQKNIWIGTDSGLNKLVGGNSFERFLSKPINGIAHHTVKAIYQDNNNVIWVGTQNGLTSIVFKNNTYRFKNYINDSGNNKSLAANDINSITEDLNYNLWIGTHFKGLDLFNRTTETFKHFVAQSGNSNSLSSNVIRKVRVLKDGKIWIATLNGINVYDPVNNIFNVFQHDPEDPTTLNQNSTYDVLQDNAGSVWVGTYYGGVNVYHANAIPFKIYKHYSYKNSVSSNIISAIVEDSKNNLWIGTEAEGLNYYNRTTGTFTNFRTNGAKGNSLSSNLIKAISIDKAGGVWIAAYEGGLDYFSPTTGQFKNYKLRSSNNNSLNASRVTCLLNDRQGRLWIGSKDGLYSKLGDDFISLLSSEEANHIPAKSINSIFQDKEERVWVSTTEGVYYLNKEDKGFQKISLREKKGILNNINCIQQDNKGQIWFGSYNTGLIAVDYKKGIVRVYTSLHGLPANNITGIVEDNDGYLWVSTDKGLAKFESGSFKIYTRRDGLPGNVFNYNSCLKDSKGLLFFGGYNGMVSFKPESIKENKKVPAVVFTGLKLFGKEVSINDKFRLLSKSLNKTEELVFSYDQDVFSIDFSVLNFIKSGKNRYAYKLEGFDEHWNYTDLPTATFTNLPDGAYTLFVKGANNDGVWSENLAGLKIIVKPPFWKTWWAYLFYILFAVAVLFLFTRFLLIRALLKREHDINKIKLDFFTHVSHEIRTPLTLILGPLEKIIQETQQNKNINRQLLGVNKNVRRLSRLVNELMDFRKIESGKMRLTVTGENIVSFSKEIFLSFQQIAIQRNINYHFISDDKVIEAFFDKDQLEKVLYNLLSNAFKFVADRGDVMLKLTKNDQEIKVEVIDNGLGIPKESRDKIFTDFYQAGTSQERKGGTGIGLALSKSIAKLHHGDLLLDDQSAQTCFRLILKTGNSHFKTEDIKEEVNSETAHIYALQSEVDTIIYPNDLQSIDNDVPKPTVLVVDDNPEIRAFLIQSLQSNYEILDAEDGERALLLATDKIPDLVISDVMMPVMDGFEFCRKVKSDERTSHIPVILLTARSGEIHELDGLKTGADVYLTKPFSMQKLQLTVNNLMMLQESMRKKFSQQLTLEPLHIIIDSSDEEFLNKVLALLEANITNTDFNVNQFASEIGMSTPVFYKKIKALTGLTVNNFVKSFRLKRAAQLLAQNAGTIYEISYMVGFNDAKYFSKEFRKQFGKSPSEYSAE